MTFSRCCDQAATGGALVALLAGCSGGGGSGPAPSPRVAQSAQRVSGTLSITSTRGAQADVDARNGTRRPDYVSAATAHAALFIDGAATPAGSTSSCSATSGAGTACTISWSASLSVPAAHVFAVETDDGSNVLSEGRGTYSLVAGSNTLSPALSLNGDLADVDTNTVTSCSGATCNVTAKALDADAFEIAYNGSMGAADDSQNPTSGNVFDDDGSGKDDVEMLPDDSSVATITGIQQLPYTEYSLADSGLYLTEVSPTGTYALTITCKSGATGNTFIVAAGGKTASGDVSSTELSNVKLNYRGTGYSSPIFTCANGAISAGSTVGGTLPIN